MDAERLQQEQLVIWNFMRASQDMKREIQVRTKVSNDL